MEGAITGMVTPRGRPLDTSKLIILIILEALWVHEALGDMLTSIVSNSHFGNRPGAKDMIIIIIFSSHFLSHVSNNIFPY